MVHLPLTLLSPNDRYENNLTVKSERQYTFFFFSTVRFTNHSYILHTRKTDSSIVQTVDGALLIQSRDNSFSSIASSSWCSCILGSLTIFAPPGSTFSNASFFVCKASTVKALEDTSGDCTEMTATTAAQ